jgi:hypothetical protein
VTQSFLDLAADCLGQRELGEAVGRGVHLFRSSRARLGGAVER